MSNSPNSPCWQQEQIAAQNAYLDAQIRGEPTPYVAPCRAKPKEEPKPASPDPKVS